MMGRLQRVSLLFLLVVLQCGRAWGMFARGFPESRVDSSSSVGASAASYSADYYYDGGDDGNVGVAAADSSTYDYTYSDSSVNVAAAKDYYYYYYYEDGKESVLKDDVSPIHTF